jgi:hypothetical protein
MRNSGGASSRYLVEWYTPHLRDSAINDIAQGLQRSLAALPTEHVRPELLYAVEVPQDGYAFGVFSADSADLVTRACQQAGLPADRVTAAVEVPLKAMPTKDPVPVVRNASD